MKTIYLASPYSDPMPGVRAARAKAVARAAGNVLVALPQLDVFTPIAHGHAIANEVDLPTEYDWWRERCISQINRCHAIAVLLLTGWDESRGVRDEIRHYLDTRRSHSYISPIYIDPARLTDHDYLRDIFSPVTAQ